MAHHGIHITSAPVLRVAARRIAVPDPRFRVERHSPECKQGDVCYPIYARLFRVVVKYKPAFTSPAKFRRRFPLFIISFDSHGGLGALAFVSPLSKRYNESVASNAARIRADVISQCQNVRETHLAAAIPEENNSCRTHCGRWTSHTSRWRVASSIWRSYSISSASTSPMRPTICYEIGEH